MKVRSMVAASAATLAMVAASTLPAPASAATNPYERGPAPTESSVTASLGPFAYATKSVPSWAVGYKFDGGTMYYPTTTSVGTFGGVAVVPGYTGTQSTMSWYGPRLASNGFVVFTIDTKSIYDNPDERATQLLAALDYLTQKSSIRDRVDPNRLAVMGHSMGGGGSLRATEKRPSIKASIPLTPWHTDKTWGSVSTPTLIVGAENDSTASVGSHAIPFYTSLPSTTKKAYLELNDAGHFVPNSSNKTIGKYSLSWLKRFVDNDTRYSQFLCGPDHTADSAISDYRSNCPY